MDEKSILKSVMKDVDCPDNEYFKPIILTHINGAFSILYQMGVGPVTGYRITDETPEWTDYILEGPILNLIREYIPQKVRLIFDPPTSGIASEALRSLVVDYEARIYNMAELGLGLG